MAATITKPVKGLKRTIQERLRSKMADVVARRSVELFEAQMDAAIGKVVLEKTNEKGETSYMTTMPDTQAAKLLLEYTIGKPVEKIEHSGAIGIVALVKQLEGNHDSELKAA